METAIQYTFAVVVVVVVVVVIVVVVAAVTNAMIVDMIIANSTNSIRQALLGLGLWLGRTATGLKKFLGMASSMEKLRNEQV